MTRALALRLAFAIAAGLILGTLLGLTAPMEAAGNVPGAHLWPEEPEYIVWIDAEVIAPLWLRCDLDPCGDWYQRPPDPAPVPLPGTITALALGLAGLGFVKGTKRC